MGIKEFEPVVSAALPDVVALVPKEPAARLGRWEPKEGHRQRGTRVQTALNEIGDLLSERLLGALELAVDRLAVDIPHDLVSGLTPSGVTRFGMVGFVREATATKEPVAILETLHPGATDLVVDLVEALRDKAAVLDATGDTSKPRRWESPLWPGEYRIRVHVTGRDDAEDSYDVVVWQAPAAPEVVHKKTDRLGHRLRGELEPPLVIPPHAGHRWIEKSSLNTAATITVVHGLTPDEVISTFGGDPAAPVSIRQTAGRPSRRRGGYPEPFVAVLAVDDIVLAVEDNGYQGADTDTLTALSHNGKAASLYWNVNANFQLTIAEHGKLLYAGDPRDEPGAPHTEDLDFDDFRHRNAKGLTAVARFAGRGITANDLAAIHTADQAYVLEK